MATESSFWLEVLKKGGDFFSNVGEEILGEKVKAQLEDKLQPVLKLLASPEGRKAFDKAFAQATTQFKRGATTSDERQFRDEIVKLLDHTTKKGVEEASREVVQSYVLASEPDRTKLDRWVQRQLSFTNFSVGKRTYTPEEVTEALDEFFVELGRSFWDQELFREKAIQAETTQLLRQILEELRQQTPDLAAMRRDYLDYLGRCFAYLDLGGIAPKVNNRTVKLMMRDIYVPIEAEHELNLNQMLAGFIRDFGAKTNSELEELTFPLEKYVNPTILEQMQQALREFATSSSTLSFSEVRSGWEALREKWPQKLVREKVDIKKILTEPRTVLLGHPGTGKSTTLRYIAFALATGLNEQVSESVVNHLPILVRLVKYAKTQKQNPALTLRDFVRDVHDPERARLFRYALENGECLVMLDGLDEVIDPSQRAEITDEVEALVAEYPDNHYLVASRIVGYETGWLTGDFVHFTIGALPEESIKTFLQKWYEAIEREGGVDEDQEALAKADALAEAIQNRPGMKRLAENPLLLTIIALVNQKERRLPNRRIEVYRYAAETLVESWPRVQRSIVFDSEEVLSLLAPVAYRIFSQQSSEEIAEDELFEMLVDLFPRLKPGLNPTEAKNYLRELLPQLSEHSGLFLERGFDAERGQRLYGFLHLTFAEYLAARHLASLLEAEKEDDKRRDFLAKYALVPRWREVVLLMTAHIGLDGRRAAATQVLSDILQMNLPYDDHFHRKILLAGRCLADDLRVESEAATWVFENLTNIMLETTIVPLRSQIAEIDRIAQGSLYKDEIVDRLLNVLWQAESTEVRARIAWALGQLGSERAVDSLVAQLSQEESAEVRASIAWALGQLGSERAVDSLVAQLSQEESAEVRASIAMALGQLGSERSVGGLLLMLTNTSTHFFENSIYYRVCDWVYETILEIEVKNQTDPGQEILKPSQPIKGPWS